MPEKTEEKVVVAPGEVDPSQEKIDVTPVPKVSDEEQLVSKIKADFEQLYGSRLSQVEKQFENFRHGSYRIQDELKKENQQLKAQLDTIQKPAVSGVTDPWAGIQDGQAWREEIKRLAHEEAQTEVKSWQAEQQMQQQLELRQHALESSKQRVTAKYPDLDPETGTTDSLVSQAYVKVLNEHPDWLSNPYGPELAMYAMEEQLKEAAGSQGKARAPQASLAPPRPLAAGGERMTLTREQKEFCDYHKIKYEDFLKNVTALETTGGLEV